MFIDQITGKQSKPGEKCHRVPASKRVKIYYKWVRDENDEMMEIECSRGLEIVRELNLTDEGLRLWTESQLEKANKAGFESVEAYEQSLLFTEE
jgi:hypothetical protein